MPILHQMHLSGNCYKVRLCAAQVGVRLTLKDYGVLDGATRKPEFLALNPNGRVPLLEYEDGRTGWPSLALSLPSFRRHRSPAPERLGSRPNAAMDMFFEQYSHEPYIAVARFWLKFAPAEALEKRRHLIPEWHEKGRAALCVMNTHLAAHDWFAGGVYSIADIALYAYTHAASDGGFDLSEFPVVGAWLSRVASATGHIRLESR